MTIVYFMRHSEPLKCNNINNNDSLQVQNEKWCLSIKGEEIAKEKSKIKELSSFDIVFASNYVRAISTAKYFTNNDVYIEEAFGERKFGVNSWKDKPTNFEEKQFTDFDYKFESGESLNEVINRETDALNRILNEYKDKNILIVGHATALAALLSKWCEINLTGPYLYNGKEIFDGKWGYCETFKLEFDGNNNLMNIENIKYN